MKDYHYFLPGRLCVTVKAETIIEADVLMFESQRVLGGPKPVLAMQCICVIGNVFYAYDMDKADLYVEKSRITHKTSGVVYMSPVFDSLENPPKDVLKAWSKLRYNPNFQLFTKAPTPLAFAQCLGDRWNNLPNPFLLENRK